MLDPNHAPPGPSYLQILFIFFTSYDKTTFDRYFPCSGVNRFVKGGYPPDFTDAKVTFCLRGEFRERGAKLVLLVQAAFDGYNLAHMLTGQPFDVTPEWSEQTVTLTTDPDQWNSACRKVGYTVLPGRSHRGDPQGRKRRHNRQHVSGRSRADCATATDVRTEGCIRSQRRVSIGHRPDARPLGQSRVSGRRQSTPRRLGRACRGVGGICRRCVVRCIGSESS